MHGKRLFRIVFLILLLGILFAVEAYPNRHVPFAALETWLRAERHLPGAGNGSPPDASSIAYILGGPQDSLGHRIGTAARLYRAGRVGKVLLLHRSGITEFSPALGRNLENDEWAARKLREEGVAGGHVEFVSIPPAVFGTFAEARIVSALAQSRGAKHLVIVSSMHHTKRAWISFSHFNAGYRSKLYIYGSDEAAGPPELLREAMKLLFYRYLVLPIDGIWQSTWRSLRGGRFFRSPASTPR
jgi:hypothetical protein